MTSRKNKSASKVTLKEYERATRLERSVLRRRYIDRDDSYDGLEVPVSDAIGRHVSSYDAKRDIEGCISLAQHIRWLKGEREKPKPSQSSATIVRQLLSSVEKTMRLLEEIELATDVRGEFHETLRYLEFKEAAYALIPGISNKDQSESLSISMDDVDGEIPWAFLDVLTKEEMAKFNRIVNDKERCRKKDLNTSLDFIKNALGMIDKTGVLGKGRKRDLALDTFLRSTAYTLYSYWRDDCKISDVPSSPFFKLVDELARLGGVELADRTLRERIERMILETRADKWGEKD